MPEPRIRRTLNRFALLGLVATFLAVVAPAEKATAAPVPCVRTFTGPAFTIKASTSTTTPPGSTVSGGSIVVPASSDVEDINVKISATHPNASNLRLDLLSPQHTVRRNILQPRLASSGAQVSPLTWDDEAADRYVATSPGNRAYKPAESLSEHDGFAAGGTWRLYAYNWSTNQTGQVQSWSITISYTICDADGDGAEDHSDNCRGLANPDQADLDGDRVGDACDGDPDGDGIVGPADNCPRVASTSLADTDGDQLGDVCDTDDDADGKGDAADGCPLVAAGTATGCPRWSTTVVMRKKRGRLVGRATAGAAVCSSSVELALMRKKPGRDQKLLVVRARASGRFRTRAPRLAGRYHVVLKERYVPGSAECGGSRSKSVRIRR